MSSQEFFNTLANSRKLAPRFEAPAETSRTVREVAPDDAGDQDRGREAPERGLWRRLGRWIGLGGS